MKVFVGLSGGVDSSVAAALLQKEGHVVHGVYLKVWSPDLEDLMKGCPWEEDVRYASAVANHLKIPFEVWDVSKEYYDKVVSYFFAEYEAGRTPNPDIMCNREIKFGIFLERARSQGADFIATGHYVRKFAPHSVASLLASFAAPASRLTALLPRSWSKLSFDQTMPARVVNAARIDSDRVRPAVLLQAKDLNKDQSYFLYSLTQEQLTYALFPIGEYTKPEVRVMAKEWGLPTADRKDSQGLCFLGKIPVRDFLKTRIKSQEGELVTVDGKIVGIHEGAQYFTIGQRHGIGSPGGGTPYFVVDKNVATNRVIVAKGKEDLALYKKEVRLEDVHWISGEAPMLPLDPVRNRPAKGTATAALGRPASNGVDCMARIRYRQALQECRVTRGTLAERGARVPLVDLTFTQPQRAVTPGQACVFYDGEHMLGGGIIA